MVGDELLKSVAVEPPCLRARRPISSRGSAATNSPSCRPASRARDRRHRSRQPHLRSDPRSLRMPRPSGDHRRQHRHRAGAAGRFRSRRDPQERGSRDVCGEVRRPPHLSLLQAGDGRPGAGPPRPGNGFAAGDRRGLRASKCTISPVSTCRTTGSPAARRWCAGVIPQRGMISPADFVPIAEETGLINQLGEWVLTTACAGGRDLAAPISRLAVNVSPVQFKSGTLALKVMAALGGIGPAGEPAGTRDHRSGADPRRRRGARHPAPASRHRRADRARRFRHRLFLAELSAALPVRQDQDRPLLRHRYRRAGRVGQHRAGGGEHRRRAPHDDDGGRRRDRAAAGIAARARLFGDAGLSVQPAKPRRRHQALAARAPADACSRDARCVPAGASLRPRTNAHSAPPASTTQPPAHWH